MKLPAFLRASVCLSAVLVIGGAWAFHMAEAHHDADGDCQVCAAVCSPELNYDCGTELLSRPENYIFIEPAPSRLPARTSAVSAFCGRAPPFALS